MSALLPRLRRNSVFGAGLISDALPPLGGPVGAERRPGPAWWSTSSPRKRGSCCIACVALCTARLCPTPSAHLVQQGEVPVREPPQAEHCANGWADRVLLMAHALSLRLRADIEIWVAGGGAASRQAGWPAERGGAVVIFTVREAWQVTCARRARGCSAAGPPNRRARGMLWGQPD